MPTARSDMTVRVVPLNSRQAGDARMAGTVADRVALVAMLSAEQWALTGRPVPTYTRATMPVAVVSLRARSDRD